MLTIAFPRWTGFGAAGVLQHHFVKVLQVSSVHGTVNGLGAGRREEHRPQTGERHGALVRRDVERIPQRQVVAPESPSTSRSPAPHSAIVGPVSS